MKIYCHGKCGKVIPRSSGGCLCENAAHWQYANKDPPCESNKLHGISITRQQQEQWEIATTIIGNYGKHTLYETIEEKTLWKIGKRCFIAITAASMVDDLRACGKQCKYSLHLNSLLQWIGNLGAVFGKHYWQISWPFFYGALVSIEMDKITEPCNGSSSIPWTSLWSTINIVITITIIDGSLWFEWQIGCRR